ncbi:MAG: diacylglyceryl transferase, partial [Paracoccus sp. (in: a-proteobacteria)]|nr:diacylglyceryl transferase [Paracoccus sp. (in: a-proteobacteria)]
MALADLIIGGDDIHPIDIVESVASHHAWDFDRITDDQITMT